MNSLSGQSWGPAIINTEHHKRCIRNIPFQSIRMQTSMLVFRLQSFPAGCVWFLFLFTKFLNSLLHQFQKSPTWPNTIKPQTKKNGHRQACMAVIWSHPNKRPNGSAHSGHFQTHFKIWHKKETCVQNLWIYFFELFTQKVFNVPFCSCKSFSIFGPKIQRKDQNPDHQTKHQKVQLDGHLKVISGTICLVCKTHFFAPKSDIKWGGACHTWVCLDYFEIQMGKWQFGGVNKQSSFFDYSKWVLKPWTRIRERRSIWDPKLEHRRRVGRIIWEIVIIIPNFRDFVK